MNDSAWIAVDWGTTRLRAWAMAGQRVLSEGSSDQGMNTLDRAGFEPALISVVEPWLGRGVTPVVACGMVGSRQGWCEAPYQAVPCAPVGLTLTRVDTRDARIDVHILPGLRQDTPPDVMRGEETQIAGYLAEHPDFDGIVCLPGTHTKWVHISAGEVVSFRTFMTGELFALMADQSVLRHTVADSGWDKAAFLDAVSETLSRPETLTARFFELRASALLTGAQPETARARLSGLLIGAELAAARPYWLGQQIVLIGNAALTRAYAEALAAQGAMSHQGEAGAMTRRGLAAAHAMTERTPS